MPKLPGFDSSRQLTTQQPQFLRTGRDESAIYDIAAKGLAKVAGIAMKWDNAVNTIQATTSKANSSSEILDLLNRADNEIDYNAYDKYVKELPGIKKNNLKGFSNKAVESQVALSLDHDMQVAEIKLRNIFKKKMIEVGQVNTFRLLDLEKSNYATAPDEQGKIASATKMRNIIDAQVAAGIFGIKEGDKIYKSSIKEAQVAIKDKNDLKKKQEKEVLLAKQFAKNDMEDGLVQLRIEGKDAEGNPVTPDEIINMTRTSMDDDRISERFGQVLINSLKSVKFAKPTELESIIKYNELVDRNKALHKKESSWLGFGRVPFKDLAKFRADTIGANADGLITNKQMTDLLSQTSKTFYRDPVFQNALDQLAAQSSLYASAEAQAKAKAEMYGSLMEKVIAGAKPDEAVQDVINEKIASDVGKVTEQDEYGFVKGEVRNGYTYIGNNQWQKK